MRFVFISATAFFQDVRTGGAESSMLETALQLSRSKHPCIYIVLETHKLKKDVYEECKRSNLKIFNLSLARFNRFVGKVKFTKLTKWLRISLLSLLLYLNRSEYIYCYYEPIVLDLLRLLPRNFLKYRIVMRMAGLMWYYRIINNNDSKKQYT